MKKIHGVKINVVSGQMKSIAFFFDLADVANRL